MKTDFIDVNETRKNLVVEIRHDVVDAEIDKMSRDYSKAARIPGFRPGKVPAKVVRQRFRDQILHDVAHGLIPRAVDEALRERGVEPVDTPDIKRRRRRGGAAAEVHGDLRHRAADRSRRLLDHPAAARRPAGDRHGGGPGA